MLYIIGGVARSGKSILARRTLKEKLIPFLPLDGLVGMLQSAAPEHNVCHEIPFIVKSVNTWKFSRYLFKYLIATQTEYLVEGDCILPRDVAELQIKKPGKVKCCFLGYCTLSAKQKLDLIREFNMGEKDWTNKHDDEAMLKMIEEMIEYSTYLKNECEKHNIKFFDISEDFERIHTQAYDYLVSEESE